MTASTSSIFDEKFAQWKSEMSMPWARLKYGVVQANLAKHLGPAPLRILDAGGGNGLDSIPLAAQGHLVDIVDYSTEMLADAAERAARVGAQERISLYHSDLSNLMAIFPPAQFDVALCHNVVQYIENVSALLQVLARLLKPGGCISLVTINRYSTAYQTAFFRSDLALALEQLDTRVFEAKIFDHPMTTYSAIEVCDMLRQAGLTIEQDYGVRCICDYWGDNERKSDPAIMEQLEKLELALTDRFPYKLLARYLQVIARKPEARS